MTATSGTYERCTIQHHTLNYIITPQKEGNPA